MQLDSMPAVYAGGEAEDRQANCKQQARGTCPDMRHISNQKGQRA
jgi:hypothetical protein